MRTATPETFGSAVVRPKGAPILPAEEVARVALMLPYTRPGKRSGSWFTHVQIAEMASASADIQMAIDRNVDPLIRKEDEYGE
jgi:hypothetical protein